MKYTTDHLTIEKRLLDDSYWIRVGNAGFLGDLIRDGDGFYYFWPEEEGPKCLTEEILIEIVTKMKELNDPARDNLAQMAQEKIFGVPFDEDLYGKKE